MHYFSISFAIFNGVIVFFLTEFGGGGFSNNKIINHGSVTLTVLLSL